MLGICEDAIALQMIHDGFGDDMYIQPTADCCVADWPVVCSIGAVSLYEDG